MFFEKSALFCFLIEETDIKLTLKKLRIFISKCGEISKKNYLDPGLICWKFCLIGENVHF
jgi:hypothetical protein